MKLVFMGYCGIALCITLCISSFLSVLFTNSINIEHDNVSVATRTVEILIK